MQTYQSTPDYYNEYIAHYGIKGMKWKKHKAVNPYVALDEGINKLRGAANDTTSRAKKKITSEVSKSYNSAKNRATSTANKTYRSAVKKSSSVYNSIANKVAGIYDEASDAYTKNRKKRKQVAAGKKLIKQHNINKRAKTRAESDNAVYYRALKNARHTIKRRKSNQ